MMQLMRMSWVCACKGVQGQAWRGPLVLVLLLLLLLLLSQHVAGVMRLRTHECVGV
jgi:hypothetical protein